MKRILVTGGAGFIGSHVVRHLIKKYASYEVYNLDALTYAGNLCNLKDVESSSNYTFIKGDITDVSLVNNIFNKYKFDYIINLAAESHVDRSISCPNDFAVTNILGTINLLEASREIWRGKLEEKRFYQVSTDEVFGSLGASGYFVEETPYAPNSPYSASKASADHFVRAYGETYNLPFVISNCSNNYGPNQYPEKLIPLFINNILEGKSLPVYGDGNYTRDWLYVEDHAIAIDMILHNGSNKETYNIGGFNEWKNLDLVRFLCRIMDKKFGRKEGSCESLIEFIEDRPGHDLRYAIDASKINRQLGWKPSLTFEEGLEKTVDWYLNNDAWLKEVNSSCNSPMA